MAKCMGDGSSWLWFLHSQLSLLPCSGRFAFWGFADSFALA